MVIIEIDFAGRALIYLVLERKYRVRIVGAFIAPFPFLVMAYASLNPNDIQPLVPALQSNWLIPHVVTCFVGYAAFAVSSCVHRGRHELAAAT